MNNWRNVWIVLLTAVFLTIACTADAEEKIKNADSTSSLCTILPADNIWNVPINTMPVNGRSADYITNIGATATLHPDFGTEWEGAPNGIPHDEVSGSQPLIDIAFDYDDESDTGPYPIPPNPSIEGGNDGDGDRHIIIIDNDNCTLYEIFYAWPEDDGTWSAGSGAIFDLNSNALRPDGWTSADAAGLPVYPGLIRYDEVQNGVINHAIRFTTDQTQRAYVWPARHFASSITDPSYPPMGQRFRLKAEFDISTFSPDMQVILTAFKTYGLILADNGSPWFISGEPNENWDNDMLREMGDIPGSAFEAVDVSSLMVDPNSGGTTTIVFTDFVFLPVVTSSQLFGVSTTD